MATEKEILINLHDILVDALMVMEDLPKGADEDAHADIYWDIKEAADEVFERWQQL